MEYKDKVKIVLTVASLAAISIFFTTQYRRRRKQNGALTSCYLHKFQKPQCSFKRVLADNSYSSFKHLKLNNDSPAENSSNLHPYEAEITGLLEKPQPELIFLTDEIDLKLSDYYVWVEKESQLSELALVLSKQRIFSVDTEQHSLRSFLGFTALIQISTQKEDYLVDTIALHDVMGILRPVFADPNICKVFHGADNDVLWLERDFHIYVVNLFDTAKACDVLSKPQRSLAYLLETYCSVATNKLLQLEDWRQRPLSVEMVQYARTDAHYLLYIANCLITELKQQDSENSSCPDDKFHFLLEASRRSNMICLQLYSKDIESFPGDSAASSIISRHINGLGSVSSNSCENQFQDLVRRLCAWRDIMARIHDESLRYVLSDQAIVALADKYPTTSAGIYETIAQADSSKTGSLLLSPSSVVYSHFEDVHKLIQNNTDNLDNIFSIILHKCLGPNGSCPLSVFNYALLVKCNLQLSDRLYSKPTGGKHSKQVARKASRDLFVKKFSCKAPVYHNCRIYANDGRLLCYCDRRKLEWYIRRDLAKLVEEDPPAIMLLFEPKGRPEDEDNDFYIQSKKNICVGCGEGKHYLRYRIIPSCYRIHFPEHLKSHRSHDIVLLCVDCHEIAHSGAEKYKKEVAAEFGIPLFVRKVVDSTQAQAISTESLESVTNFDDAGVSPLQLRTAAMALLRHGPRMPPNRREELIQIVMKYYGGRKISEEDLERALLVGMSPHEKRRLEKKRGISLKHCGGIGLPEKQQKSNNNSKDNSSESEFDTQSDSHATEAETLDEKEDSVLLSAADTDVSSPSMHSNGEINEIFSSHIRDSTNSDTTEGSDTKDVFFGNDHSRCPPNRGADSYNTAYDGISAPKHNSKLSLLGHGPHGKQVVDFILKEYGEDGVGQFCQRWRQAFIEAVKPQFLPAGWDVMHSGKRDFGEFSVYKPAKNIPAALEA